MTRGKGSGKGKGGRPALCFLFCLGKCRKGDSCAERHPDEAEVKSIRERMERTDCKFGESCTRKECIFRHPSTRQRVVDRS